MFRTVKGISVIVSPRFLIAAIPLSSRFGQAVLAAEIIIEARERPYLRKIG
jgi:hypothetical protein